jgi:hypothetical protein
MPCVTLTPFRAQQGGASLDPAATHWYSIRQIDAFRPLLGDPDRPALVWLGVACLARIRRLLGPDAIRLADMVQAHAEGLLDRAAILAADRAFIQAHYTPRIVRAQSDTEDIDIGEFDSLGNEAAAHAAGLVVGDLADPDDWRFNSTREMFWLIQGLCECCRHEVMATFPEVPWGQEDLPPELEPLREALLQIPPAQWGQIVRTPEINPRMHAVLRALGDARRRREDRRQAAWANEELAQCHLVREAIRPPFVTPEPSWRTPNVVAVARGIYEGRSFDHMPILGDALQDAGCEDEQLLGHCRDPGPHFRGCWVIQWALG